MNQLQKLTTSIAITGTLLSVTFAVTATPRLVHANAVHVETDYIKESPTPTPTCTPTPTEKPSVTPTIEVTPTATPAAEATPTPEEKKEEKKEETKSESSNSSNPTSVGTVQSVSALAPTGTFAQTVQGILFLAGAALTIGAGAVYGKNKTK